MKKLSKIILFSFVFCFSISCLKQTESITPIAPIKTLAELQKESLMQTALMAAGNNELSDSTKASIEENSTDPSIFYLNLKYNISNMDVYEETNLPNSFEQIGNSFLKTFAKIFLKLTGSRTINIGTIEFPIPDLNLDFQVVKSIKVKRIFLKYNKELNEATGNKADFSFISSLNIAKTDGSKLFTYKKANNRCLQKCLDFTIINGDVFEMIKDVTKIKLNPMLTISSFPKINELKLDGQVDLQVGLKLPF